MGKNAEEVGRMWLNDVDEIGLDELLSTLRSNSHSTVASDVNFEPIDRLLAVFMNSERYKQAPTIEITSAQPNCGTSHFLYHLIAALALPHTVNDCHVGGKTGAVVFLDAENGFDVHILAEAMRAYIMRSLNDAVELEEDLIERTVVNALQHVHVFTPQSMTDLQKTLKNLPDYLFDSTSHHSSSRQLEAIILDSASSFFWQDRMETAEARFEDNAIDQGKPHTPKILPHAIKSGYQGLLQDFRQVQKVFNCAVVATAWGIYPVAPTRPRADHRSTVFRSHLPQSWTSFFALRLVVDREAVAKFAPEMTIEEAFGDSAARQAAVDAGKFLAWLNLEGSQEWSQDLWQKLQTIDGTSTFKF